MTATPLQSPYCQFFDNNGDPLSGGLVYTYLAGTTTPKASYTDYTGLVQNANPVVLDSAGRAEIWCIGTYRIDVKTSTGTLVRSTDNLPAVNTGGDMTAAIYDPANIAQQVVGTTAVQTITNKTLTSPTINTPTINQPNIVGVTDASTASAGSVGEVISSKVAPGSSIGLTTNTAKTITSITLTAGCWDISAVGQFNGGATTTVYIVASCINTVTDAFTTAEDRNCAQWFNNTAIFNATNNPAGFVTAPLPTLRVNISSTTTYYLVGYSRFSTSTCSGFGAIRATRIR